tara:strand:+ start:1698 stop:2210 length:513 start_codon:yes stop_codon:yes gene_type:complete
MKWTKMLLLFWASFWVLNGGDKFFNGEYQPIAGEFATSAVIYDMETGEPTARLQPMKTSGGYGVNRDNKMADMFSRIGLPRWLSSVALYATAIMEVGIGLMFLVTLVVAGSKPREEMVTHLHQMSAMVFMMFTAGDILFGERMELWEHCTFLLLVLVSNAYIHKEIGRQY